jgi:DNA-binding NarL/FixJ family response regulator
MAGNVVPASRLGLTYTIQMRWDINRGRRQADRRWDRKRFSRPSNHDEKDSVNVHEILNGLRTLTPREHDVLNQVVLGRLNKEIASELGITIRTVKEHRARVMEKMEANSLAELVTMIVTVRLKQPISTTLP